MYRAFNLKINHTDSADYKTGQLLINLQSISIKKTLDTLLASNGTIDGKFLESVWFPQVEADVFISHSHADKDLAIALAGWLKNKLELNAFVDSTIWGYANELLLEIDKTYCTQNGPNNYNYAKRNISTSHVHVMLCAAITKMMDRAECLMFLDTPNSISTENVMDSHETNSPWIYYELGMAGLIQKSKAIHPRRKDLSKSRKYSSVTEALESAPELRIAYPVSFDDMTMLNTNDLERWHRLYEQQIPKQDPLDALYSLF
ncbi:hypothetical protein [Pedobacter sp. UC225_65]|uniref:hypothetical protein n=1 Tax=Pedobacter sp. UC225_65 TaxID=3350173 RepID=UPI00366DBB86